eukprot:m.149486 g.149486  ORF g.149486 m.149486 type:complete len:346 (+) comp17817_c0_seq2:272-1309(+)
MKMNSFDSISSLHPICAAVTTMVLLIFLFSGVLSRPWTQHEVAPVNIRVLFSSTASSSPSRVDLQHRGAQEITFTTSTARLGVTSADSDFSLSQMDLKNESFISCAPIHESPILRGECDKSIPETDSLLVFEMDASQGLGCQLLFALRIMKACEKMSIKPYFRMISNRSYQSSAHEHNMTRDFLQYGFLNCGFTAREYTDAVNRIACGNVIAHGVLRPYHVTSAIKRYATDKNLPSARKSIMSWSQQVPHSLLEAHEIFHRHLRVRPDLQQRAAKQWRGWFVDASTCVIGVHYRGNDKVTTTETTTISLVVTGYDWNVHSTALDLVRECIRHACGILSRTYSAHL